MSAEEVRGWHRGNWMQTFTGTMFYPLDPRPEDICVDDIAHSLSMQCRYNGHGTMFYSVAEHCILMAGAVSPENALHALLHDATEAYVGDMVRPLKLHMPEFRAVEDRVGRAIADRFGMDPLAPEEVKLADSRILLDERTALFEAPAADWGLGDIEPLGVTLQCWEPALAERIYTDTFFRLLEKKQHHGQG